MEWSSCYHVMLFCWLGPSQCGAAGGRAKLLDEAARDVETTEIAFLEAELHRLRGDLLTFSGRESARRSLSRGVLIASGRTRNFSSCAPARSLAQLWRHQDSASEARDLLARSMAGSPRFDAPDLKDAKALLDELVNEAA